MGWIKALFFSSERVKRKEEMSNPVVINGRKVRSCMICKGNIMPDHKMTKQNGRYYHKPCWKQAVRQVGA